MNVTCPSCTTIYRVDPAKVPAAGVRARCKVCSSVFPVTRGEVSLAPSPGTATPAMHPVSGSQPAIRPIPTTAPTPAVVPPARPAPPPPPAMEPEITVPRPSVQPPAAPVRAASDLDATMKRPALPATLTPRDPDLTVKRPSLPMPPSAPDVEVTFKRPAHLAEPSGSDAPAAPAAPSGPPASAMPPAAPPATPVNRPAAVPPALPGFPRPTAPRQFPPTSPGSPKVGGMMPPPAVRNSGVQPAIPASLQPPRAPMASPSGPPAAPVGPPAARVPPTRPAGRPVNPFLSQDPAQKARRLARALISDLAVYYPDRRKEGMTNGTLKELFQEEIQKSWEEYTEQVGKEVAESTSYFNDALNEILAGGQKVF